MGRLVAAPWCGGNQSGIRLTLVKNFTSNGPAVVGENFSDEPTERGQGLRREARRELPRLRAVAVAERDGIWVEEPVK